MDQNQILLDHFKERGPVSLGVHASYTYRHDPKHLLFALARYKFCAKMLSGKSEALEVGCGDGFGAPLLLDAVGEVHGVDIEPAVIQDNIARNEWPEQLSFALHDIAEGPLQRRFDAAVSMDVIEHIEPSKEARFMENLAASLTKHAVCLIGTPNVTAQGHSSGVSAAGHINMKSAPELDALLRDYFYSVFLFSMNDEIVHTGFHPMAHYLIGLGVGPR